MHKAITLAAILAAGAAQAQDAQSDSGPFERLHVLFCDVGGHEDGETGAMIWRHTDDGIEGFGHLRGAEFETQGSTLRIWVPQTRTTWEIDTRTGFGGALQAGRAASVVCVIATDDVRMIAAELLGGQ